MHPVGTAHTSYWSVNCFIMLVCEKNSGLLIVLVMEKLWVRSSEESEWM